MQVEGFKAEESDYNKQDVGEGLVLLEFNAGGNYLVRIGR